jgi:hypothetical protein
MKDYNRARLVILRIQKAFTYREGLLAEVDDLVENQIPDGVKTLSREHALFLFYIIVNDHGMKSSRLYARAKELFRIRPELFEATKILEMYNEPNDSDLMEATGRYLGKFVLWGSKKIILLLHRRPKIIEGDYSISRIWSKNRRDVSASHRRFGLRKVKGIGKCTCACGYS